MKNAAVNNIVAAFGEDQAERLTGTTKTQLRYWDRTDLFHPSYADENRKAAFSRVYSFSDVVALRVLNVLRNQYGISLQHLRKVSERLSYLGADRWTGVRLYVLNKRVIWHEPGTQKPQEIASQQYLVPLDLDEVISDTRCDVGKLNQRDSSKVGKIVRSRNVNHNAPIIAGTRIPVSAIKSFSNAGYSPAMIQKEYPDLSLEDIDAAIGYEAPKVAA